MKRAWRLVLAMGCVAACMSGCGTKTAEQGSVASQKDVSQEAVGENGQEQYSIQISTSLNDSDPLSQGLFWVADELDKRSNGRIQAQILTSGLLGDTADVLEQVRMGVNVGVVVDAGRFADYVPEMMIFEGPYLFANYDEAFRFTQSDMFKGWMEEVEGQGIHVASWNYFQGARHLWTQKEIRSPEDIKGIKIRTGTSPVWQAILESMGAKPVNIAGSETYQAIQQKVCDGLEGQIAAGYSMKLNEVTDYLTKTSHFQLLTGLVVSNDWYQALPEDLQVIFDEVCMEGGNYASEMTMEQEQKMEEEMKASGMVIIEPDLEVYREITDCVYDKFDGFRQLKEQIQEVVKQ